MCKNNQNNPNALSGKKPWTYILPILLQQRNQEIDTELHILEYLFLLHSKIPNSNTHAKNLLELELHHCLCFINLGLQRLLMTHQSWKLTCSLASKLDLAHLLVLSCYLVINMITAARNTMISAAMNTPQKDRDKLNMKNMSSLKNLHSSNW